MDCQVCKNDPQKTTELFSFGRPKEEKLKSHRHPQREATAPTQVSQPEGQRGQPVTPSSPTRVWRRPQASERFGDGAETNRLQLAAAVAQAEAAAVAQAEAAEHNLSTQHDADLPRETAELRVTLAVERREREREHSQWEQERCRWEQEREQLTQQAMDARTSLGISERLL
ncbi:hypothetical protein Taro_001287 [Colocasia esculenta]|uniref:Uncharacterized protein n=1 Tax=Colocasia esculenta TaxID=4460 RepID=A0A843TIS0_COLES|nr:hypothetical protein [Colocasia esculenta]